MLKRDGTGLSQPASVVLVVDDDPLQRLLLGETLERHGLTVLEAGSGREARSAVDRHAPDLVLLDRRLPDWDGIQWCSEIHLDPRTALLPVILITAAVEANDIQRGLEAGAVDFVRKPFEPLELMARVNGALKRKHLTDQLDSAENILFSLARMVDVRDAHTGEHGLRLGRACLVFGESLGLSPSELDLLHAGAILHDLGKVGIPDRILLKEESLDAAEWRIMRRHPEIGAHLVEQLNSIRPAAPIIRHHHERWDGSGYPDGLAGEDIPYLARVFQLVDIFDALRFGRPYRESASRAAVMAHLTSEAERGWREPELTGHFLDLLRRRGDDLERMPDLSDRGGGKLFDRSARLEAGRMTYGLTA